MTLPFARRVALALCTMLLASRAPAQTVGALTGRVVNDRTDQSLAGVEVSIAAISRSVSTDSSGRFVLRDITAGRHEVVLRKVGYQPSSTTVTIPGADGPERLLRLAPVTTELAKVYVVTSPAERRLASFEAHRNARMGGSFLTAAELAKERGRSLADVLQALSGADIVRLRGGAAFFATRRGYDSFMNMPRVSAGDRARGASPGLCYAAVEVYKGGATMPLEYNATRKTCGALVIYTK